MLTRNEQERFVKRRRIAADLFRGHLNSLDQIQSRSESVGIAPQRLRTKLDFHILIDFGPKRFEHGERTLIILFLRDAGLKSFRSEIQVADKTADPFLCTDSRRQWV